MDDKKKVISFDRLKFNETKSKKLYRYYFKIDKEAKIAYYLKDRAEIITEVRQKFECESDFAVRILDEINTREGKPSVDVWEDEENGIDFFEKFNCAFPSVIRFNYDEHNGIVDIIDLTFIAYEPEKLTIKLKGEYYSVRTHNQLTKLR